MKKKTLLILCAIFVLLIIGASVLYNGLSGQVQLGGLATQPTETSVPTEVTSGETVGETTEPIDYSAPDFTVYDAEGNPYQLSEFEGKPVVLNFWASWCGPCKSEMPDFEEAYQTYGEEIHFLMVNCTDGSRETVEIAADFIAEQGYTFPVYFDTTYEASYTYGASSIPMTFFIDANGDLVTYGRGALSAELLEKGISMIYTPAHSQTKSPPTAWSGAILFGNAPLTEQP